MKAIVADLGNSDGMSFVPADINSLLSPALLAPGQYVQNEQLPSGYGKTFDSNWKAPEYVPSPVIVESAAPAHKPVVEYPVLTADEFRNRQRYAESAFNNRAVSGAGAKGAYQIMPSVLSDYIKAVGKEGDLFDYEYNKGVRDWYVDWLLKRSAVNGNGNKQSEANKWAKVAAAYNWGLGNLQKYLVEQKKKGVDIYNSTDWVEGLNPETRDYVKFVALQQDTTGPRTTEAFNKAMSKYNIAANGGRIKTLAAKLMGMGYYSDGGTIHIDPSKRGTFKAQATKMGMGVKEAAHHILAHKDNYSPSMVKKANFAANFAADGGTLLKPYNKVGDGGQSPNGGVDIADLVKRINETSDADFVRRLLDKRRKVLKNNDGTVSTHEMSYVTDGDSAIVFPNIQSVGRKLKRFDYPESLNRAIARGDTLHMTIPEAEIFTTEYKNYYPGFDRYCNGGVMLKPCNK